MLNWLKEKKAQLKDEVARFKNKDFMEATVAACALVSAADGSISSEEKQKMMGFIQHSDALSVFKAEDVIASFNKIVGKFEFDMEIGKAEAFTYIGKVRKNADQARLLVRVCCAIGAADGEFDASEVAMVKTIARDLGLDPAEFDLD